MLAEDQLDEAIPKARKEWKETSAWSVRIGGSVDDTVIGHNMLRPDACAAGRIRRQQQADKASRPELHGLRSTL